jgi:hypothetical protein
MTLSVFGVLIILTAVGVAWGDVALAPRQSKPPTVKQTDGADGVTDAKADWAIAPAHMRGDHIASQSASTTNASHASKTRSRPELDDNKPGSVERLV